MIQEKDLIPYQQPLCYRDGSGVTLDVLHSAFYAKANEFQISMDFKMDQIKSGGIAGIGGTSTDCLVLFHPDHLKDYFRYVITIQRQGTMAFVSVFSCGASKNSLKLSAKSNAIGTLKDTIRKTGTNDEWSIGLSLTKGLGKAALSGLASLGGSKSKREAEEIWYDSVAVIINEVIH